MKKTPEKTQLLKINIKYKYNTIQTARGNSNIVFRSDAEYHNKKYIKNCLGGQKSVFQYFRFSFFKSHTCFRIL